MTFEPRSIWIRLGAVLSPVALAGCVLPLGLSVATYGVDGVAYVTEGKSTTDMAISSIQGENCALWRIVQGKPVCRAYTAKEEAQIAENRAEIKRGHPEVILMTEDTNYDQVATPAPKRGPVQDVNATEVADAGQAQPDAPPAVPVAAVRAERLEAPAATKPASAQSATSAASQARPGDVYLVLGNFATREKAERVRDLYARSQPGLTFAVLDGPALHRVASGPLAPGTVAAARARIVHGLGIAKPWVLPACPSEGGPGCATMARLGVDTTQLAALPN